MVIKDGYKIELGDDVTGLQKSKVEVGAGPTMIYIYLLINKL